MVSGSLPGGEVLQSCRWFRFCRSFTFNVSPSESCKLNGVKQMYFEGHLLFVEVQGIYPGSCHCRCFISCQSSANFRIDREHLF